MLDANGPKSFLPANWILQLQDVEMRSPALQTSTAAFFAARVAQSNNDKNFAHQCRSMYVESLKQLQIAMACPRARLSDETLAACMALSLYELTGGEGATGSAYMAHMRGAMALLELRGPDASASPLGHSLFLDLRAHEVSNFSPFPASGHTASTYAEPFRSTDASSSVVRLSCRVQNGSCSPGTPFRSLLMMISSTCSFTSRPYFDDSTLYLERKTRACFGLASVTS